MYYFQITPICAHCQVLEVVAMVTGLLVLLNFLIHQVFTEPTASKHFQRFGDLDIQTELPNEGHQDKALNAIHQAKCPHWKSNVTNITLTGYDKVNTSGCTGHACSLNWGRRPVQSVQKADPCVTVEKCLTITIKTRYRYATLSHFLHTIWKYYPGLRIIIADEINDKFASKAATEFHEVVAGNTSGLITYFQTRPGVGLGRLMMVKLATTKYVLVVDDDFIVTDRTNLTRLLEVIEHTDLDIVAGETSDTFPYAGAMRVSPPTRSNPNNSLHLVLYPHAFYEHIPCFKHCYRTDIVKTFFLANRKSILAAGSWDSSRLFYEHEDFFLQMRHSRLNVGVCRDVVIQHRGQRALLDPSLAPLRRRQHAHWRGHLLTKWTIHDYYICPKEYYQYTDFTCPLHKQIHFS